MTLIEQARQLAKEFSNKEEAKRIEKERSMKEWEQTHASEMVESMKAELKDHVLTASKAGSYNTYLFVYSWSKDGRPHWVNLFRPYFEEYLTSEGFKFEYSDDRDPSSRDPDMPHNDSGGYRISW
jgi:hypothetical protein